MQEKMTQNTNEPVDTNQSIKDAGISARKKFLAESPERKGDWGRPLLGTALLPVIGTIIGFFVRSAAGEHALREADAVQAEAELKQAKSFHAKGDLGREEFENYAVEARRKRIISTELPANNNLTTATAVAFLPSLLFPLLNVAVFINYGLLKKANVRAVQLQARTAAENLRSRPASEVFVREGSRDGFVSREMQKVRLPQTQKGI